MTIDKCSLSNWENVKNNGIHEIDSNSIFLLLIFYGDGGVCMGKTI